MKPSAPFACVRSGLLAAVVVASATAQTPRFRGPEVVSRPGGDVVALGDVDGDGDQDAVTLMGVRLNDGNGRFVDHPVASAPAMPWNVASGALADFDQDGDLDLLGLHDAASGRYALAYENDGGGVFSTPVGGGLIDVPSAGSAATDAFVGDLDGAGGPDVVVNRGGAVVEARLMVGVGAFAFADESATRLAYVTAPFRALAYWNPDSGDEDYLVLNDQSAPGSDRRVRICLRSASGVFLPIGALGSFFTAHDACVGQFGGSAAADLVVVGVSGAASPTDMLFIKGTTGFLVSFLGRPTVAVQAAAVDVDHDGIDDLVRVHSGGVAIHRGVMTVSPIPQIPSYPTLSSVVHQSYPGLTLVDGGVADLDGDGDRDLVLRAPRGSADAWLCTAAGAFAAPYRSLPGVFGAFPGIAASDLDCDGDLDLVAFKGAVHSAGRTYAVNDGSGRFSAESHGHQHLLSNPGPYVVADFDGDGRDDHYQSFPGSAPVLTVDGAHCGEWGGTSIFSLQVETLKAAAGDLNGDGHPDLVRLIGPGVGGSFMPHLAVNIYDGAGSFLPAGLFAVGRAVRDFALLDVDGDGKTDVFAAIKAEAGAPADPCALYRLQFGAIVETPFTFAVEALKASAGDVDGDGVDDVVLDGQAFLNVGGSFFALASAAYGFAAADEAPVVVDLDLDGDGDLVVASGFVEWDPAYGYGAVVPWPEPMLVLPHRPLIVADFDGDGDADVVDARGTLLRNLRRDLASGAAASPGRLASLHVSGVPGAPYDLIFAAARLAAPLAAGSWGSLSIDPASALLLLRANCDASGDAALGLLVPNDLSLIGYSLWWQAALLDEGRLTGLAETKVFGL